MTNSPSSLRPPITRGNSAARRDQILAGAVGLALLAGSMWMSSNLVESRKEIVREPESNLRSLAAQFPRLTLGGFRGLLAMVLWIQAEEAKNERRWVELETKYDIIGALQPYFVSVYIFHSWNQAYNLSAQWHSVDAKYKWVLDGLSYLYKGEEYNPGNPDLLLEQGHLYFLKLGGSFERIFYRAHWREDIARLHALDDDTVKNQSRDVTEALKHVYNFTTRKQFNTTLLEDPTKATTRKGWGIAITDPNTQNRVGDPNLFKHRADGKPVTDPVNFRYGVSPYYFAHIEYKRCLAAGAPTTTGLNVVDAWPAMALRLWCRDDLYYSNQIMADIFAVPADKAPTGEKLNAKILEAQDCFRNVQMIAPVAIERFEDHLLRFKFNETTHRKHIRETEAYQKIALAQSALLDALLDWQRADRKITPTVDEKLKKALPLYENAAQAVTTWVDTVYPLRPGEPANPDRFDFERYAYALRGHAKGIQSLLTPSPTTPPTPPDMSFLNEDVVER